MLLAADSRLTVSLARRRYWGAVYSSDCEQKLFCFERSGVGVAYTGAAAIESRLTSDLIRDLAEKHAGDRLSPFDIVIRLKSATRSAATLPGSDGGVSLIVAGFHEGAPLVICTGTGGRERVWRSGAGFVSSRCDIDATLLRGAARLGVTPERLIKSYSREASRWRCCGGPIDVLRLGREGPAWLYQKSSLHKYGTRQEWLKAAGEGRLVIAVRRPRSSFLGRALRRWLSRSSAERLIDREL
jgi:hypothetical protein